MITKLISKKITIISLLAMLMVVLIHSINYTMLAGHTQVANSSFIWNFNIFLQNFISNGIARISVPLFFIISGFLFFKKFSFSLYKNKIHTRFFTLFIPYVFWSALVFFIFYFLQSIPPLRGYFAGNLIVNSSLQNAIYIILIDPINYPLWFLRNLIILVLFSPMIFLLIKYIKKTYFIILMLLWSSNYSYQNFSDYHIMSLLFFSFGAYLALYNQKLITKNISNKNLLIMFIIYFVLLITKTILSTFFYTHNVLLISVLLNLSILMGIPLLWLVLDRFLVNSNVLNYLSTFTFLFYVFQEPTITILKKIGFMIFGKTAFSSMLIYALEPLLVILILIGLGIILKSFFPKISKVITGNRLK